MKNSPQTKKISDGFWCANFKIDAPNTQKQADALLTIFTEKVWCNAIRDFIIGKYNVSAIATFSYDENDKSIVTGKFSLDFGYLEQANKIVQLYESERRQLTDEQHTQVLQCYTEYHRLFDEVMPQIAQDCQNNYNWFDKIGYFRRHGINEHPRKKTP